MAASAESSPLTGMTRLLAWVTNSAVQIEAAAAAEKLLQVSPTLLRPGEHVDWAFKVERDHFYFTSDRVLFRNKQGWTGKKVQYMSVPYASIKAWEMSSAGHIDTDADVRFWCSGLGQFQVSFAKGKVDVFAVQRFLNRKILASGDTRRREPGREQEDFSAAVRGGEPPQGGKFENFLNILGGDERQVTPEVVEAQLRESTPVLEEDERVELAFRCGRDTTCFTSKRLLFIDVQGWSGKKVAYLSILWKSVRAFSVETAGSWDRDCEVEIHTNISEKYVIRQDLRNGKADVFAIQRYISNMVLGVDVEAASGEAAPLAGRRDSGPTSLFEFLGDDARQIDAEQANRQFHSSPAILQSCEHVEMAFKGRRDMMLFTTKRLISVDMKGWSGKKVKYSSVPWPTVQMWGVRSAGSFMDKDSEMMIWTDIHYRPGVGDNPPEPGMAYLEQDFRKDKVDLMAVHRYLSERCLARHRHDGLPPPPVAPEVMQAGAPSGVEGFMSWLGQDAQQISAEDMDRQLHGAARILQADEQVIFAFKCGRDTTCFTTKRVFIIDVQGWSGSKVEYKSVPYGCLRAFSAESAGAWDRDSEVKLYPRCHWGPGGCVLRQDLRKGKADIISLQFFLAQKMFGRVDAPGETQAAAAAAVSAAGSGGVDGFFAWLGGDARAVDASEVNQRLHQSPVILLPDETAESAFKVGRDLLLLTNKRVLLVDVQGFTGKKVEYFSVPLHYCKAWSVRSAGTLDFDEEASIWTDVPAKARISTDLRAGGVDLFAFEAALAAKFLRGAAAP